jgi:predicted ATP-grasp superfamily ATP-dependent carboligase
MAIVLIGFADALAAPEVFFSLHHAGHRVRVFQREGSRAPLAIHLPVDAVLEVPDPARDVDAAVAALRRQVMESPVDAVLALDDPGLWLVENAVRDTGAAFASATGDALRVALDKTLQVKAAAEAGLAVPATRVVGSRQEILQQAVFPAIVKPALAVGEQRGRLGKGATVFLQTEADLATLPAEEEFQFPCLVQPLIHGVGEGVFGFATPAGVTAWSGHTRERMMNPHGSGASACRARLPELELGTRIVEFIRGVGWQGPFMVELLRDENGTPWFMEFNGRLWGSTALARRQGFEYPAWAVAQAFDPEFIPAAPVVESTAQVRHLGREILHLAFVLRGPSSEFHKARWPCFWRSLLRVLAPSRRSAFYNFDPAFPWFFLREAVATVGSRVRNQR